MFVGEPLLEPSAAAILALSLKASRANRETGYGGEIRKCRVLAAGGVRDDIDMSVMVVAGQ